MDKLLDGLNSAQKQAVKHGDGPALVVAGAGTGKTTVITRRIAHLISSGAAKQDEILALTFTEKAANEMEERLDLLLPYGAVSTNIMTFHALGDNLLRQEGLAIGLASDYVLMPAFAQIVFLQNIIANKKLKYYKPLHKPFDLVRSLLSHFSRLKDESISPAQYTKFAMTQAKKAKSVEDKQEADRLAELADIYATYVEACRRDSRLDFGDQIGLAIELLKKRPNVAREMRKKYKYILVDEYQDTNFAQNQLLECLVNDSQNIMVVGDDDQAIYRFRGAALANILEFATRFPKAKQIVLRDNYRSTREILDASYNLISHNNPDRLEVTNNINKKLHSEKTGKVPQFHQLEHIAEEMNWVAKEIKRLNKEGTEFNLIAILLRKNNQTKAIIPALNAAKIPFSTSQTENLLDRAEIRALLNFVNVLNDPKDSISLYGLLASEVFASDAETLAAISARAKKTHQSLSDFLVINQAKEEVAPIYANYANITSYNEHLSEMASGELLFLFLSQSGFYQNLLNESEKSDEAALKIQNIAEFFKLVKQFELASLEPTLHNLWHFLGDMSGSAADILAQESPLDSNAVKITTIHKAKGLEYDVVFIIDLARNTFPSTNRTDSIPVSEELLPLTHSTHGHIGEERRLFYVAMTRAREKLYFTFSADHGGVRAKKPSQFIAEAGVAAQPSQKPLAISGINVINQFEKAPQLPFDPLSQLSQNGWLHLGANQIADYIRSPREFWYFNVLQVPKGPFHTLVFGSSIHAAIEAYLRSKKAGAPIGKAEMLEVFNSSWRSEGFVSHLHESERKEQAKATLANFWTQEQKSPDLPAEIELKFNISIEELKLRISGRYDAVYKMDDGVEITDFKTGAVDTQKKADARLKDNFVMDIYAYAWDNSHKEKVRAKSLLFVEHGIKSISSQIDHAKTLAKLEQIVSDIRAKKFASEGESRLNFKQIL